MPVVPARSAEDKAIMCAITALLDMAYHEDGEPLTEEKRDALKQAAVDARQALDRLRADLAEARAAQPSAGELQALKRLRGLRASEHAPVARERVLRVAGGYMPKGAVRVALEVLAALLVPESEVG